MIAAVIITLYGIFYSILASPNQSNNELKKNSNRCAVGNNMRIQYSGMVRHYCLGLVETKWNYKPDFLVTSSLDTINGDMFTSNSTPSSSPSPSNSVVYNKNILKQFNWVSNNGNGGGYCNWTTPLETPIQLG